MQIADMICGNFEADKSFFTYRSSSYLTSFFYDCDTDHSHDGSTRNHWVADVLRKILSESQPNQTTPPEAFLRVIQNLMAQEDSVNEDDERPGAIALLNKSLAREGYEAFYALDKQCYLRHVATNSVAKMSDSPHRPLSQIEVENRSSLSSYMDKISEDELIEEILLPLLRQLGFQRITSAGHRDKALEYGKDIWMKFILPTTHVLYFGIQVKKGKLDSSGMSKATNSNIAEIHNQVTMMLGHEIFDPEIGKRVLVDHAFIIAGGVITNAARNWLGNKLDASKRSQVMFMDRDDILNLFIVNNLPLPNKITKQEIVADDDDMPF
ncbi:hypothetical protein N9C35_03480 [Flavobacteriaceae bacterium]|nr:hypothetical protein [Flavobacteriaceae bacterium]